MLAPTRPLLCTGLKQLGHHTTIRLRTVHRSSLATRNRVSIADLLLLKTSLLDELANLPPPLSFRTTEVVEHLPPSPSLTSVTSLSVQNHLRSPVQKPPLLSLSVPRLLLEDSTSLLLVRSCRRVPKFGRRSLRCSIPS